MNKIYKYLTYKISNIKFILLSAFIFVVLNISLSMLITNLEGDFVLEPELLENYSQSKLLIISLLIAPIFETLIFQFYIIKLVLLINESKKGKVIAILVSGVAFGLQHFYNIYYMILGIILGILLATIYLIAKYRINTNAFVLLVFIHALSNFTTYMLNNFVLS